MKLVLALSATLTCVAALAQPECAQNFECLAVFEPVCGSDGVTYSNNCLLKKAQCKDSSITKRADGACTASDKPTTTAPPAATTKVPEDGPAATTAAPDTTTTTSPPADATPSPSKGSSDGDSAASKGDPQETNPSVATTAPTTTAPVPAPTKSNAAPLYAVGASAVAAWVIAALL